MNGRSGQSSAAMRNLEHSNSLEVPEKKNRRGGVARTVSAGVPIDPSAGFVLTVNENDVLCGRGSPAVENEGNVRFRHLIQSRKGDYINTTKRVEKEIIAREVYDEIVRRGGRFLRRIESLVEAEQMGVPEGKISWTVIPKDNAIQKIKQALRDRENVGPLTLHDGSDYSWTEQQPSFSSSSISPEVQEYKVQSGHSALLHSDERATLAQIQQQQGDALSQSLFHPGEVHRSAAITALLRGRMIPSTSPVLAATLLDENRRLGHLLDEKRRLRELLARDPRFMSTIRLDRTGPVPGNDMDRFSSHLLMSGERDIGGGGLRSLLLQAEELKHKSHNSKVGNAQKLLDHLERPKTVLAGQRAFQPADKAYQQHAANDPSHRRGSPPSIRGHNQRARELKTDLVEVSQIDARTNHVGSRDNDQEGLGSVNQSPAFEAHPISKDSVGDSPGGRSSAARASGSPEAEKVAKSRGSGDLGSRKAIIDQMQRGTTPKKHRTGRNSNKGSSPSKDAKSSPLAHGTPQTAATNTKQVSAINESKYQQDSKGHRCLLLSYDRFKSSSVVSRDVLPISMIELHIVSALCSHGHPVFDGDREHFREDTGKLAFEWTDFASVLVAVAERWIKRLRVGDEESNVLSSAFVRDLESENKAFALAEKYALDPLELATKTVMLLEKIFKRSRSKAADREWTLAGSIVGWLHVELRSWATSLNISEYPGGRPVAYSSEDFICDAGDNAVEDAVVAKALLTAQDCRDILVQIAAISRLRSVFLAEGSFDATEVLHEEHSKSQTLKWTEGPCWWGAQGGEQHFRHDAELMELVLLHGHISVLECEFETFEPPSMQNSAAASIKIPCARLGLTNASVQERITELSIRLHACDVAKRKRVIMAKRKDSFINEMVPAHRIREEDGICEHKALVAAAILGLASGSEKDNHSVVSNGEVTTQRNRDDQHQTRLQEHIQEDSSSSTFRTETDADTKVSTSVTCGGAEETEVEKVSKRTLVGASIPKFKKQKIAEETF